MDVHIPLVTALLITLAGLTLLGLRFRNSPVAGVLLLAFIAAVGFVSVSQSSMSTSELLAAVTSAGDRSSAQTMPVDPVGDELEAGLEDESDVGPPEAADAREDDRDPESGRTPDVEPGAGLHNDAASQDDATSPRGGPGAAPLTPDAAHRPQTDQMTSEGRDRTPLPSSRPRSALSLGL